MDDGKLDKIITGLNACARTDGKYCGACPYTDEGDCVAVMSRDVLELLKEHEAEIRQLRLALDIAKGTCKGIKSGGGQFADMPTMQSAT